MKTGRCVQKHMLTIVARQETTRKSRFSPSRVHNTHSHGALPSFEPDPFVRLRRFCFDDFVAAFGWMASVALVAERLNHHPEWRNVYATVEVELTTHDAGGLTPLDFELAAAMDRLASGD